MMKLSKKIKYLFTGYDLYWGIIWPVMRYFFVTGKEVFLCDGNEVLYITGNEALYDRFWGIIWPVLRYYMTSFEVFLNDRFWGIIWPVLWGTFDVKFDVTVFCRSSPLLCNFSMLPFRCPRFFFSMFSYSISPSFPTFKTCFNSNKNWHQDNRKNNNKMITLFLCNFAYSENASNCLPLFVNTVNLLCRFQQNCARFTLTLD